MEGQISYEQQLKEAHLARKARLAARAVPDRPIACVSASARAGGLAKCQKEPVKEKAPAPKLVITDEWVQRQLAKHKYKAPWFSIVDDFPVRCSVADIMRIVARFYQMPIRAVYSEQRSKDVALVRHVGFYLCKELTTLSLPQIGRLAGGRDHSTVIHGIDKIKRLIAQDEQLAATVAFLRDKIVQETTAQVQT